MTSLAELAIQRKLTQKLIDALPVTLVLTPRSRVSDGSGGWSWADGSPRTAQTFHLIEFGGSGSDLDPVRTADGAQRFAQFQLLGAWDSLMANGDKFTYGGEEFEIVEMMRDNGWERRALVSRFGGGF
jgi:hypothetical protein